MKTIGSNVRDGGEGRRELCVTMIRVSGRPPAR